jgi:hypothetical protein
MAQKYSTPYGKNFLEISVWLPSTEIVQLHVALNLTVEQVLVCKNEHAFHVYQNDCVHYYPTLSICANG